MVYLNSRAEDDLFSILVGLLTWDKHVIEYNHAESYVNDIQTQCYSLDKMAFHANAKYDIHKQFGEKVYRYRRNKNTTWYIIYNYDKSNNVVYIQHIMPNHTTKTITEN